MRGGLRQAVWYPLSHESHSKIWRGRDSSITHLRFFPPDTEMCYRFIVCEQTGRHDPPAPGDLVDRSVCRGRRSEVGRRPRTWRSPSFVSLGYDSAASCSAPPCSLRRCRLLPRSPPLRSTPLGCPRLLRSLSFYDASGCWTIGPSAVFSPKTRRTGRAFLV